ncbi:MAG: SUMF1/EgtB/PvdO family nonheme iron enzyme [Rhodospirillales bacterium]|nr:SUMF1/EgtB/PvdO family nonheme iron enzyme [Rhodospirillales bacterium]
MANPPKVFISYSHDSPQHEQRVLELANRLRQNGVDAEVDQYEVSPAEGWPLWCQRQIVRADFVLMVCTDTYLRRVEGEEEAGRGLGVLWEANFIRHILYNSGSVSRKFVPVLFSDGSDKNVPWMVSSFTRHQVDVDEGFSALWGHLRNEPAVKKPPVGTEKPGADAARPLPPKQPKPAAVEAAREQEGRAPVVIRFSVRNEEVKEVPKQDNLHSDTVDIFERVTRYPWDSHGTSSLRILRDAPGLEPPMVRGPRGVDHPKFPMMVELPPGEFMMGSPDSDEQKTSQERYQHLVTIGRPFAIGRFPITFSEYDFFCSETKRRAKPHDENWGRASRPVINVSWTDAKAYVDWLAEVTGEPYRLTSEAEWEYACRAGTTKRYWTGDQITTRDANFGGMVGSTTEATDYLPNPWGLHDMHGNVLEWVEDIWHDSYGYEVAPADGSAWTDHEGPASSNDRVLRGGSWNNDARFLRSASRFHFPAVTRNYLVGFRVARGHAPLKKVP